MAVQPTCANAPAEPQPKAEKLSNVAKRQFRRNVVLATRAPDINSLRDGIG